MTMDSLYKSLQNDLEKIKQETEVGEAETNSESFTKLLEDCLAEDYEIIQELDKLLSNARYYHSNCNIAKTTGTAASCVGAASMIGSFVMAPMTGGMSLIPGAVGAGLSVSGGVTNVVTDIVEDKITKGIIHEIETLVARKEKSNSSLNNQIRNIRKILDYFDLKGIAQVYGITTILRALANQTLDLSNLPNTNILKTFALSAVVMHEAEDIALKYLPQVGKYISISQKHLRFLYSFFGITTTTGATALKAAGRVLGAVSAGVFAIVDIVMLVRDWRSNPPSESAIVNVKKQILDEIEKLQEMLEIIESLKDKVWYSKCWGIHVISSSQSNLIDFFGGVEKLEVTLRNLEQKNQLKNTNVEAVIEDNDLELHEYEVQEKLSKDVVDNMLVCNKKYGKPNERYHVINQKVLTLCRDIIQEFARKKNIKHKNIDPTLPIGQSNQSAIKHLMIANLNESVYYIDLNECQFFNNIMKLQEMCINQMCQLYDNPPNIIDYTTDIRVLIKLITDQVLFVDQVALRMWLKQSTCSKLDRLCFDIAVDEIKYMLYKLPDHLSDWVTQLKS